MDLREEFIRRLAEDLDYCSHVDDAGSIDHCMAQWQEWVKTWPQIADEYGGI